MNKQDMGQNLTFAALVACAIGAVLTVSGQRASFQAGDGIEWSSLLQSLLPLIAAALIAAAQMFGVRKQTAEDLVGLLLKLLAPQEPPAPPEPTREQRALDVLRKLIEERLKQ